MNTIDRKNTPAGEWNYRPGLPLTVSPLFTLPLRPRNIARWLWGSWFLISERLIVLAIAFISWFYFHPTLEQAQVFEPGWIGGIYIRNLVAMILVAGGLHLYLYTFHKQANRRRYDARDLTGKRRAFTFNSQVLDNMFWTLASGVTVWTAFEVLMMWSVANGYAPYLDFREHPIWFVTLFLLIPPWESFYFYLIHRLLHWPPLYRSVHSLHHRNTNVGPWSGLSMHPIEHVIYLGSVMVHFLVACHPLHILFHLQYFTLTAATTHSGYESLVSKDKERLALGTFHHQMHHRYFECNYGSLEIPWDKWFGSFHDGTSESHQRMLEQMRQAKAASASRLG